MLVQQRNLLLTVYFRNGSLTLYEQMAKKIFSQDPESYVVALAATLKEIPEFQVPEWSHYVKTGSSRERPPLNPDFWFIRSASILRQLYIKGVIGVEKLRTRYGSRKDRGTKPDKFRKASGKIIRLILQQAEKAGLVEKVTKLQSGRRLSEKGRQLLDSIEVEAKELLNIGEILIEAKNPSEQEIDQEGDEVQEDVENQHEAEEEQSNEKGDKSEAEDIDEGETQTEEKKDTEDVKNG